MPETMNDVDAMLEKDFNITADNSGSNGDDNTDDVSIEDAHLGADNDPDNTTITVDDEDDNSDDADTDTNSDEEDDVNSDAEASDDTPANTGKSKPSEKPSKKAQEEYNFAQLRAEKKALEQEAKFVKDLAAQYGYTDVEQFKVDYQKARDVQEAKNKGVDPAMFARQAELEREVNRMKAEKVQEAQNQSVANLTKAIDAAVRDYTLGEKGQDLIISRLENAGIPIETLLAVPNPKVLIDGVLADKISAKAKQDNIKKLEKLDNVADDKHTGTPAKGKLTVDDLIKSELPELEKLMS